MSIRVGVEDFSPNIKQNQEESRNDRAKARSNVAKIKRSKDTAIKDETGPFLS